MTKVTREDMNILLKTVFKHHVIIKEYSWDVNKDFSQFLKQYNLTGLEISYIDFDVEDLNKCDYVYEIDSSVEQPYYFKDENIANKFKEYDLNNFFYISLYEIKHYNNALEEALNLKLIKELQKWCKENNIKFKFNNEIHYFKFKNKQDLFLFKLRWA
jgi:hypothetical protein